MHIIRMFTNWYFGKTLKKIFDFMIIHGLENFDKLIRFSFFFFLNKKKDFFAEEAFFIYLKIKRWTGICLSICNQLYLWAFK